MFPRRNTADNAFNPAPLSALPYLQRSLRTSRSLPCIPHRTSSNRLNIDTAASASRSSSPNSSSPSLSGESPVMTPEKAKYRAPQFLASVREEGESDMRRARQREMHAAYLLQLQSFVLEAHAHWLV